MVQHRKRRRQRPDGELQRRAERALSLVQIGELSSGRHALEGDTPNRRPPLPRDPLPPVISEH